MKIADIERALSNSDPKVRYYIANLQEQIIALAKQMDESAKILIMVVQTLENVQRINLQLSDRWEKRLMGDGEQDIVQSVMPDPED
jgi:hypothetical protein